ncbi:MAG: alpha/beta hydrolase, partial [Actinomycetia bacterium]|nr:alpha/beta hydrolase [Actinomycetes bacterium]
MTQHTQASTHVPDGGVHPELRAAARFLPKGSGLHRSLRGARIAITVAGSIGKLRDIQTQPVNSDVGVRVHRPAGVPVPGPALLWIHGGGMVMGSASQDDKLCRRLSHLGGVAIAAVEYRLAPEHPYPTPLEDCYAALMWLAAQPWVDPERIAIGGESAGGGLTASLACLARDRGEVMPKLQMLVHPMLDDRTGTQPDEPPRYIWSAKDNQAGWRYYLGGADPNLAVPARNNDFSGLPPAWIGIGTEDLFFEESLAYGRQLRAAGVPSHDETAIGAFHGFDYIVPNAPTSLRFLASQC